MDNWEHTQTLVTVARLYYEAGNTQQEIARKLNISRPQVSRYLNQAKKQGIVQITIHDPLSSCSQIESLLQDNYGLARAIVVPVNSNDEKTIKKYLGKVAAAFLHQIIKDGDIIGISWGTTIREVAAALKPKQVKNVSVVQLKGGVGRLNATFNPMDTLFQFAEKLQGKPFALTVPTIVSSQRTKEALISDAMVQEILELGHRANIALFSIGYPSKKSVLVDAGYFTSEEIENLRNNGAAGDICSRYFTVDGTVFDDELNKRTIGIALDDISKKEYAIAIAGGTNCVPGILGALRGKYLNILVTDEGAARKVLKLDGILTEEDEDDEN